ncbi:MAG: alpha/beta hydrolase-fold protein [Verrucomicrobia bacterium]|nr:alpha/beta hydrolase-fold protein [Verrucomicrobiota bacterium]
MTAPATPTRRPLGVVLAVVALAFLAVSLRAQSASAVTPAEASVDRTTFHATALEKNPLGDPIEQPVLVYLPPAYAAEPARRFPVVYLLHGLGMKPADWERSGPGHPPLSAAITAKIRAGAFPDLIVVYANGSPVVTNFGAVYALSPAFIGFAAEFGPDNPTMAAVPGVASYADLQRHVAANRVRENYAGLLYICAAALSPNPAAKPLPIDYPFVARDGQLVPNPPTYAQWQSAMPLTMLDAQLANIRRLRGIGFDVGREDHFRHIPVTTRALDRELTARGIPHAFAEFAGGHTDKSQERLVRHALPFLAQHLLFSAEKN